MVLSAAFVFGQDKTLDDVWSVLNEDFGKYQYAQLIQTNITSDARPPHVVINRLPYERGVDMYGDQLKGEVVYITIRQGGYRYTLKYDFVPQNEKDALRVEDVKLRTYNLLARIVPEAETAQATATAESPAPEEGGQ
jgi:hypothetical protein